MNEISAASTPPLPESPPASAAPPVQSAEPSSEASPPPESQSSAPDIQNHIRRQIVAFAARLAASLESAGTPRSDPFANLLNQLALGTQGGTRAEALSQLLPPELANQLENLIQQIFGSSRNPNQTESPDVLARAILRAIAGNMASPSRAFDLPTLRQSQPLARTLLTDPLGNADQAASEHPSVSTRNASLVEAILRSLGPDGRLSNPNIENLPGTAKPTPQGSLASLMTMLGTMPVETGATHPATTAPLDSATAGKNLTGQLRLIGDLIQELAGQPESNQTQLRQLQQFVEGMNRALAAHGEGKADGSIRLAQFDPLARDHPVQPPTTAEGQRALLQAVLDRGLTFELVVPRDARIEALLIEMGKNGITVERLENDRGESLRLRVTVTGAQDSDPIVLDLKDKGRTDLAGAKGGQKFDIPGEGKAKPSALPADGDGIVALDRNIKGVLHGGREIFGDRPGVHQGREDAGRVEPIYHQGSDRFDPVITNLVAFYDLNRGEIIAGQELQPLQKLGTERLRLEYKPVEIIEPGENVTRDFNGFGGRPEATPTGVDRADKGNRAL